MTRHTDPTIEFVRAKIVLADETLWDAANEDFARLIESEISYLVDPFRFISVFTASRHSDYPASYSIGATNPREEWDNRLMKY